MRTRQNKPKYGRVPDPNSQQSILSGVNQLFDTASQGNQRIQFKQIDISTPQPWIDLQPYLINDWNVNGQFKMMRHYDGTIQIAGQVVSGNIPGVIFQIKQPYRPSFDRRIVCATDNDYCLINIKKNGDVEYSHGSKKVVHFQVRYMPADNRPQPMSCFPVQVDYDRKVAPLAVYAVRNIRKSAKYSFTAGQGSPIVNKYDTDGRRPVAPAYYVEWSFVQSRNGPVIRISNIVGLEYTCKQTVTLMIVEG